MEPGPGPARGQREGFSVSICGNDTATEAVLPAGRIHALLSVADGAEEPAPAFMPDAEKAVHNRLVSVLQQDQVPGSQIL
jgi:hypothetical protein